MTTSKIISVGNYIPQETITNLFFDQHVFLDENGVALKQNNAIIAEKLKQITGIEERRYASKNQVNSTFYLPEYFIINANAFYDAKKFRVGVKVDNLTNEHYWIGYTTANPQQLINVSGSLTFKF